MTVRLSSHRIRVLAAAGLLAIAFPGWAQAPAVGPSAAPAHVAPERSGEDRVFTLVQAGKCAQAKAAALEENDTNLADQIGLMCGAKSSGAPSGGSGGGGRRGGGGGSGRRGGP